MGCVVNGPGEAREADLGVASGNGKGQIFVKGEVIKTVPESQIVETLVEEALRLADEMGVELPEELRDGWPARRSPSTSECPCPRTAAEPTHAGLPGAGGDASPQAAGAGPVDPDGVGLPATTDPAARPVPWVGRARPPASTSLPPPVDPVLAAAAAGLL